MRRYDDVMSVVFQMLLQQLHNPRWLESCIDLVDRAKITCILESRYLDSICFTSYMCIHDISVSGFVLSCTRHSLQIMLVDNPGSPVFHAA